MISCMVGFKAARLSLALGALSLFPWTAYGTAINWQLAGGSGAAGSQYSGTGAAALVVNGGSPGVSDSGTVWNYVTNFGSGGITTTMQATVDSQGNALSNGPTLSVNARQTFDNNSDGILLLNYWHLSHTSDSPPRNTFTLSNVPDGTYDLYLYGVNGAFSSDNTRGTTYTIGSTSLTVTGSTNDSFVNGGNYVVFAGLAVTGGTITGTYIANGLGTHPSNSEGQLNAVQLLTVVPEPASWMLLLIGSLVTVFNRRRHS